MGGIEKSLGLRPIEESLENDVDTDVESDSDAVPAIVEGATMEVANVSEQDDETLSDIELARSNIRNIIQQGDGSLEEMIAIAKQSESPRAFEVAANLMKTLLDANKDFVDVSMKKKYHKEEINGPKEAAQTNVTNNNLILSTKDLLEMLKEKDE